MSDDRSIPTSDAADLPTLKVLVDGAQISPEFQVQTVVVTRHFNRVADAAARHHASPTASVA